MERPQHELLAVAVQGSKQSRMTSLGHRRSEFMCVIIAGPGRRPVQQPAPQGSAGHQRFGDRQEGRDKAPPPPPPALVRPPPTAVAPPPQIVIQAAPPPPVRRAQGRCAAAAAAADRTEGNRAHPHHSALSGAVAAHGRAGHHRPFNVTIGIDGKPTDAHGREDQRFGRVLTKPPFICEG